MLVAIPRDIVFASMDDIDSDILNVCLLRGLPDDIRSMVNFSCACFD